MQNYKEKLSFFGNQSNESFKIINQSITSIRSSSQAIEAKLGGKMKNWLSPTIPTGIAMGCSEAQCDDLGSSHSTNRVQCDVIALLYTSKV